MPQKTITSLHREVVLDVLCRLGNGKIVNMEVQKDNKNDDIRRTRYHLSTITANLTPKGCEFKDKSELLSLFLKEECFDSEKFPKISKVVKYFKEDEKGTQNMCTIVEEYAREYAKEYAEEREEERVRDIARKLIAIGLGDEEIAKTTSLSFDEVARLRKEA